ncbi:hypothetical protein [Ruegeria hyattellae]|uniref:hypothetical protein n=1 Tax=Ruegeria hyattellae TaxID=3233337 RepID=UPI00355BADF8
MIKTLLAGLLSVLLSAGLAFSASMDGEETYDLLFRDGTLDSVDRDSALIYLRTVSNQLKPEAAERDTGQIALTFGDAASEMAHLEFRQDQKHRSMGMFPASVGNPMIMVFYESAVRDMAESAGGSPFYIRNRVKDALIQPAEVETGEAIIDGEAVTTQTVRLRPFEGDPNRDRMRGFGDLVLSVTVSEGVPGWYLKLVAEAQPKSGGEAVYRSEMVFDRLEGAQ